MKTHVINFFAGPGTGKSTLAAAVFADMKNKGISVELVREYVKNWAWKNRKPEANDQLYLLGKQTQAESILYGQVKYIVTDSPFLLAPIYEQHYFNRLSTKDAALWFLAYAERDGVVFHNFYLRRFKPLKQAGRFESEEMAHSLDYAIQDWLDVNKIKYTTVDVPFGDRIKFIHDKVHETVEVENV